MICLNERFLYHVHYINFCNFKMWNLLICCLIGPEKKVSVTRFPVIYHFPAQIMLAITRKMKLSVEHYFHNSNLIFSFSQNTQSLFLNKRKKKRRKRKKTPQRDGQATRVTGRQERSSQRKCFSMQNHLLISQNCKSDKSFLEPENR